MEEDDEIKELRKKIDRIMKSRRNINDSKSIRLNTKTRKRGLSIIEDKCIEILKKPLFLNVDYASKYYNELNQIIFTWNYFSENYSTDREILFFWFLTDNDDKFLKIFLFIEDVPEEKDKDTINIIKNNFEYLYNNHPTNSEILYRNKELFLKIFIEFSLKQIKDVLEKIDNYLNCKKEQKKLLTQQISTFRIRRKLRSNSSKKNSQGSQSKKIKSASREKSENPFKRGNVVPGNKTVSKRKPLINNSPLINNFMNSNK